MGAVVRENKMKTVNKLWQTPSDGKNSHGNLPDDKIKCLSLCSDSYDLNHFENAVHYITWFVTGATQQVPLVEKELWTLPWHLSSPLVFGSVHVPRSLIFCVSVFVDCCFSFCPFFLALCCLSFFDLWLLITPLVLSSNSSYRNECLMYIKHTFIFFHCDSSRTDESRWFVIYYSRYWRQWELCLCCQVIRICCRSSLTFPRLFHGTFYRGTTNL